jgi:deazaflavin-dependent oxidoreductase (nitroreductase family)
MPEVSDYNRAIVDEFRENHGKVGGNFDGAPLLLLHTVGARSGRERVNPVMYLRDGDRLVVFATKAGSPTNPDWFHNLVASPDASVEVGDETFPVHATVLIGAERDRLYAKQAQLYPGFKEYEERTTRTIPVVALTRTS